MTDDLPDLDVVPLLVDWGLAEQFGAKLRCGCVWYEGRHALIDGDCWLHSPLRPWGKLGLRWGGRLRRWLHDE